MRLTRRGRIVRACALALLFAACVLLGASVDAWSPCAGDHVCAVVGP